MRIQLYYQNWQSSSSSWWNWQESWWYSSSEHHHDDGLDTDGAGEPAKISESSIYLWNESHNESGAELQFKIREQPTQFTVTDGRCKQYLSHTAKFYEKMATTKTTITTRAMRPSVRRTTASSQTTTSGT